MPISTETLLIIAAIITGFIIILWFIQQKLKPTKDDNTEKTLLEWLKSTQGDIQTLQSSLTKTLQQSDKNVTDTLQKSYQELNTRLDKATKTMGELKEETGKFSEIGRSMKDLQDFLSSPKLRGNLGEQILNDLLAKVLPKSAYALQHRFQSGDIVDAIIKTNTNMIPIDSKFPLENFNKLHASKAKKEAELFKKTFINDVRKHIRAISQKYIKTSEGTTDFALMYVPSESVYYEITANTPELSQYAQEIRVLPVSPSTFYAFLRTILVSFEGQRIANEAQAILQSLRDIQKSTNNFGEKLQVLGKHITNAHNNMSSIQTDFVGIQTKIDTTSQIKIEDQTPTPELTN